MEAERALARTADGRRLLLKDFTATRDKIQKILTLTSSIPKDVDKAETDAVATLANIFSDDENGKVLEASSVEPSLLVLLVTRLKARRDLSVLCICLTNIWRQGPMHQKTLMGLGLCEALESICPYADTKTLMLLKTVLMGLDEAKFIEHFQPSFLHKLFDIAFRNDDVKVSSAACRVLLSTRLVFEMILRNSLGDSFVASLTKWCSQCDEHMAFASFVVEELTDSQESLLYLGSKSDSWAILRRAILSNHGSFDGEGITRIAEACAILTQQTTDDVFTAAVSTRIDQLWLEVVEECTLHIPFEISQRPTDQSLVLGYARTRLSLLTSLLNLSTGELRCRRLIELGVHRTSFQLALQYADYDIEATRVCCNLIKNFSLADSRVVVLEGDVIALVARMVKSPDQHACFAMSGAFRIVASRAGNTDKDCWLRLTQNTNLFVTILSVDQTTLHPHSRVELARGVAKLMRAAGEFCGDSTGGPGVLETAQAVKFASFLLQAPQNDLIMEGLEGLIGLSSRYIVALYSLDIEIVPGSKLVGRLQELLEENKDALDMKALGVAQACEKLLRQMESST